MIDKLVLSPLPGAPLNVSPPCCISQNISLDKIIYDIILTTN